MADLAGLQGSEASRPARPGVGGLVPIEEYLRTSYSPDREYRDGLVLERKVGDREHARFQALLAHYLGRRRKQWGIEVYTGLRIRVEANWCPIPDVCVYTLPGFEESVPTRPPVLWIEILSPDDTATEVLNKTNRLLAGGVPHVWIVDPQTLANEFHSAGGIQPSSGIVAVPGTPITIDLAEAMAE